MLRISHEEINWGLSHANMSTPGTPQEIRVPTMAGGKPLVAVMFADQSQADKAYIETASKELFQFSTRHPYFHSEDYVANNKFLIVSPYQYFSNVAITDAVIGANGEMYQQSPEAKSQNVYGKNGAFISLEAWYGDYPKNVDGRRSPQRRQCTAAVATVNAVIFRNIITGRDAWEICVLDNSGLGTFIWNLYGVTENQRGLATPRQRDLLASGTGDMSYEGSRAFDAIELEAVDAGGPYDVDISFTARDW